MYPSLAAVAYDLPEALANQGRLLPILDGLDEIDPARAALIIIALNRSLLPDGGVILTSRRREYRAAVRGAGDPLTAALAIAPTPLTPSMASSYLATTLPPRPPQSWSDLLERLANGQLPALAELVATPFGLWLLRATYLDTRLDPDPLTDGTYANPEVLRTHLLDQLIPALVRA
jgi:hypothetical protein